MLSSFAMAQNLSAIKEVSCTGEKKAAQEVLNANKVLFVVSITSNCISSYWSVSCTA
jgi:hypothetical protein